MAIAVGAKRLPDLEKSMGERLSVLTSVNTFLVS